MSSNHLVTFENVYKYFPLLGGVFKTEKGRIHAVNGVDLSVMRGETLSVAGESGCGKSTLAKLLIRLHLPNEGRIRFENTSVSEISRKERLNYYEKVQMVFQDPYASLNPRYKVKYILGEMLSIRGVPKDEIEKRVADIIEDVGLTNDALLKYPHEFSGGQRQRIAIARALIVRPSLLIADEPVSALDLSTQDKIIRLLNRLKKKYGLTLLFISHDLNLISDFSDRVAVMYLGHIVEILDADKLFGKAGHPYVKALLESIPVSDPSLRTRKKRLVKGEVPSPIHIPSGCPFHPRCPEAFKPCHEIKPDLKALESEKHLVACHLYHKIDSDL